MKSRSQVMFLGLSALTGALVLGSVTEGCQSGGGTGTGGAGGTGTTSSTTSTGTTNPTQSTTSTGTTNPTTSTSSGMGGAPPAMMAKISDITTGTIGLKIEVELKGVVAMSPIFLVSQSKTSNSCLWGVFVSDPVTGETQPNTGMLVTSYGTMATVNDGGTKAFCPVPGPNGTAPSGSLIPDDTKVGDVLDIIGQTDSYIPTTCGTMPGESTIKEFQITKTAQVTKTGTTTPPTPHTLTATELASLGGQTDMAFYNQWGGVKVAVKNAAATPQMNGDAGLGITDQYGHIVLAGSNVQVGDKIYYQGLLKKNDVCRNGPVYANDATVFTEIDGFVYLDFCTWGMEPENRCKDLNPPSDDCAGAMCQ